MRIDDAKAAARDAAIVETALQSGPVSVIVFGGAHDLSEHVRRRVGCEYIVVTTLPYREVAREGR